MFKYSKHALIIS